jgi:hypothetical protein
LMQEFSVLQSDEHKKMENVVDMHGVGYMDAMCTLHLHRFCQRRLLHAGCCIL